MWGTVGFEVGEEGDPLGSLAPTSVDPDTLTLQQRAQRPTVPKTIGRLTLAETLGVGGMGVVIAAYDEALGRRVAVKLIRDRASGQAVSDDERRRLLREARSMAQLSHPNVVEVYDAGTIDGHVYLSMELVKGQTLKQWLASAPRSCDEILAVFSQAGRGLAAAHGQALVHRDFKPSNVLVADDGRVLVTDFGLARTVGRRISMAATGPSASLLSSMSEVQTTITASDCAVGTPAYMPPEQHVRGVEADARADQFAFCAALYEALYQVQPFGGTTMPEIYFAKQQGALQRPGAKARPLPRAVRRAIMRGLEAEPNARWPSMDALLQRLRPGRRTLARRHLAWAAGLAVVMVAQMLGSIVPAIPDARCHGGPEACAQLEPTEAAPASGTPAATEFDGLQPRLLEAEALLEAAQYDRAATVASSVLLEARAPGQQRFAAPAALVLGRTEAAQARLGAAQQHLTEALHAAQAEGDDRTVVEAASSLAVLLASQLGRPPEGLQWIRHARARLARLDPDELLRARVLLAQGLVLGHMSEHEAAASVLERGLMLSDGLGEQAVHVGIDLRQALANELLALGYSEHARSLLQQALADARVRKGARHPDVGRLIFDLSLALQQLDRWDDVPRLRQEALEIFEGSLGSRHPLIARALRGLGDAKLDTGHQQDGEAYYRRAMAILERGVVDEEPDHVLRVQLTERLAQSLAHRGEVDEALVLLRRAIAMARRLDDRAAEYRVRRVLLWLLRGDDYEQEHHREADALGQDVRRDPDPLPAGQREDLALWAASLRKRGRLEEAEALYRELVDSPQGPTPTERGSWGFSLARVLADSGRAQQAHAQARRALAELELGDTESTADLRARIEGWLLEQGAQEPERW